VGGERRSDPGPGFAELEAIARTEAANSRGLAPNGGRRWTREDVAFAVSLLVVECRARGFPRAWDAGMSGPQARSWLRTALRHRLLDLRGRGSRVRLLDGVALDALPSTAGSRAGLEPLDVAALARGLRGRLSDDEARELERRFAGDGLGSARSMPIRDGPSRATRARLWSRVRRKVKALAREQGLDGGETCAVVRALVELSDSRDPPTGESRNP